MTGPLKIGIAGLGNVGAGVGKLLEKNAGLIAARAGRDIKITALSARSKKDRGFATDGMAWHDDALSLVKDPNVDIVVELIGGADGKALEVVTEAIRLGKPVVTANKALLAAHAGKIIDLLKGSPSTISFEAAVAGGIPVIKGLREGLAANDIHAIYGILNGTCNFILSEMSRTGRPFADVLKEAQDRGYAEADPGFDIDGIDAAHKLSILSGLAFGCLPAVGNISVSGIRHVSALDISYARELGYCVKLLGIARRTEKGIEQSVEPCLVPQTSPIAAVDGPLNAVYVDGDYSGKVLFMGAGAGGDATASAVVADIIDVARGRALPFEEAATLKPANIHERMGSYFMRLMVLDVPGVIADISAILRDLSLSLESVLQRGRDPGQPVSVILTTHESAEGAMISAVERISKLAAVTEPPHVMRIETFK